NHRNMKHKVVCQSEKKVALEVEVRDILEDHEGLSPGNFTTLNWPQKFFQEIHVPLPS
ncbi:10109_t:CDS:2, partial [Ambispora gerdemannii]